ncbi:MAG: glycosyltransferase family 4 protein [Betaproteobacteria bacterium]|nr:glycosyltransferase family 4 protein [Betaproteobacteria bacterium]
MSRPLRIVYLCTSAQGGMLHYAQSLSDGAARHAQTTMVVLGERQALAGLPDAQSIRAIAWSTNAVRRKILELYNPLFYRRLARTICARFRPDVVHITAPVHGLAALVGALRARGVRVVYTVHDPRPHEERLTLWGRVFGGYQRAWQIPQALARCAAVHVHSSAHAAALMARYGGALAASTYVVPHGGGLTRRIAGGRMQAPELPAPDECPTMLFFGRIEPYKGLEDLLACMVELKRRGIRARLIIAGAGSIAASSLNALSGSVTVINRFIDDTEIRGIFEASDLLVLPYRSATQSGVIPMAYAFGKPVVATRVGALAEMVVDGTTGALVGPNDPEALAGTLERLLRDSDRLKQMGEAARLYVAEHLAWEDLARGHLAVYQAVCKATTDLRHAVLISR